jgi:hypothetical protein
MSIKVAPENLTIDGSEMLGPIQHGPRLGAIGAAGFTEAVSNLIFASATCPNAPLASNVRTAVADMMCLMS